MTLINKQRKQDKLKMDLALENVLFNIEYLLEVMEEIEGYSTQSLLTDEDQKHLQLHLEASQIITSVARQELNKINPRTKDSVQTFIDRIQGERQLKVTNGSIEALLPV